MIKSEINFENNRHAYLIVAHNDFELLYKQLGLIDDARNDIYIHIDKKVKKIDELKIKKCISKSKIWIYSEFKVYWAHSSQVKCELFLLEKATQNKYSYYHLLSGVDLPIKTQDYIHEFFYKNKGKEFIHFESELGVKSKLENIELYHFGVKYFPGKDKQKQHSLISMLEGKLIKIQKIIGVNRCKKRNIDWKMGANWFSITNNLAEYILQNKGEAYRMTKYTLSGDEVFLQTIVGNSKFYNRCYLKEKENDHNACVRYIDWMRGGPYILTTNDFQELVESKCMFARKFSSNIDTDIINKVVSFIGAQQK